MEFRHAVGARALIAEHDDEIARQLPRLEGGMERGLAIENAGGRGQALALLAHGGSLDDGLTEIALEQREAARALERSGNRAEDRGIEALRRRITPDKAAVSERGLLRIGGERRSGDSLYILESKSCREKLADHEADAAGGLELVHVRRTVRIDARDQRHYAGEFGEIVPRQHEAGRLRDRHEVEEVVGGTAGGMQPRDSVDERARVDHRAEANIRRAGAGGGEARRLACQGVAQQRSRRHESSARHVQAHDFHQHLVGIRGAIEGAGARRVIALHLRVEQGIAADLAVGVCLTHARFLVVGNACWHRSRRHEDRRQMAEGKGTDQQSRHDLVADAEQQRRIEGIMRERHGGRHRDDVTREQRQLHARLALCHAIAHRGNAARDERRSAEGSRCGFQDCRIGLERLMRREHVVIGGDDA